MLSAAAGQVSVTVVPFTFGGRDRLRGRGPVGNLRGLGVGVRDVAVGVDGAHDVARRGGLEPGGVGVGEGGRIGGTQRNAVAEDLVVVDLDVVAARDPRERHGFRRCDVGGLGNDRRARRRRVVQPDEAHRRRALAAGILGGQRVLIGRVDLQVGEDDGADVRGHIRFRRPRPLDAHVIARHRRPDSRDGVPAERRLQLRRIGGDLQDGRRRPIRDRRGRLQSRQRCGGLPAASVAMNVVFTDANGAPLE